MSGRLYQKSYCALVFPHVSKVGRYSQLNAWICRRPGQGWAPFLYKELNEAFSFVLTGALAELTSHDSSTSELPWSEALVWNTHMYSGHEAQ